MEYEIQKCIGFCEEKIDGYSGFIFSTACHTVHSAASVNNAIKRIITSYNKREESSAKKEKREAIILPDFSAHNLCHTFCTRLCENESNIKVIQGIMGHADISNTMGIYAEATEEKKKEVLTNQGNETYAFLLSDKYILGLYTHCLVARKETASAGGRLYGKRVWDGKTGECERCFVSGVVVG